MLSKNIFSTALLFGLSLFTSYAANASLTTVGDLIQVSILITEDNNDCSGYFGQGFDNCEITHVPSPNTPIFAEIMGKFGLDDNGNIENAFVAPSQASDWNFDVNNQTNEMHPGDNETGQWHYTGTEYPGVSYWVTKASNDFILHWMIADNSDNRATCASSGEFSINCLSLAVSVTTGAWTTPLNKELSHISFYGNKCDNNCGPTTNVPEPTSIALFALALLGITARRKKFTL
jgi:hypothetical protein